MTRRRNRQNNNNNQRRKANNNNQQRQPRTQVVYRDRPMSVGAQIGNGLQKLGTSLVTKLMGMGDYRLQSDVAGIKKNSLFSDGKMPMSFASSKSGFCVTHTEFIGNITSSDTVNAFKIDTFPLQPLNKISFPWLAQIADAFERYEVEGVIYRFESLSGVAVSGENSSLGTVAAYFHYDPNDAPAASKAEMLQYSSSVSAKTSECLLIGAECDPASQVTKMLYVDDAKATTDKRLSSKGFFSIASQGVKAQSQVLGELFVHYKIRFHIPKLGPTALLSLFPVGDYVTEVTIDGSGSAERTDPIGVISPTSVYGPFQFSKFNDETLRISGIPNDAQMRTVLLQSSREVVTFQASANLDTSAFVDITSDIGATSFTYLITMVPSGTSDDRRLKIECAPYTGANTLILVIYNGDHRTSSPEQFLGL